MVLRSSGIRHTLSFPVFFPSFLLFFLSIFYTEARTQGLLYARQALSHHSTVPWYLEVFSVEYGLPPTLLKQDSDSKDTTHHCTQKKGNYDALWILRENFKPNPGDLIEEEASTESARDPKVDVAMPQVGTG